MTTREWDAATYDRIADPQARWGATVLDRLRLAGNERVLDAGCGSGRVTEQLLGRLPEGRVVALDASAAMVEQARQRLARYSDRVDYLVADLSLPLPLATPVDAILSTATLHWVLDHDAAFRNLAAALRPGGQLVFQCGGRGNIDTVMAAICAAGCEWEGPWNYATPEQTRERLLRCGFVDVEAWLNEEPTPFASEDALEEFLRAVILRAHLQRLPAADQAPFVTQVAARLHNRTLDYVRLNVVARRG